MEGFHDHLVLCLAGLVLTWLPASDAFSSSKAAAAKQIPAGDGTVPSVLTTSFFLMMTYQLAAHSKTSSSKTCFQV